MIRPSRHDYQKSRFEVGEMLANCIALILALVCLVLACGWFWRTFMQGGM